ncbi:MAG: hypothetical protein F6K19_00055 [Cyanothece sp. SIO1E1]|nr:hypothetical protein [Cyanothece sp. SIO1E1]
MKSYKELSELWLLRPNDAELRCFTRKIITKQGDNLDISRLRDESLQSADALPEPSVIVLKVMERLETAMAEVTR